MDAQRGLVLGACLLRHSRAVQQAGEATDADGFERVVSEIAIEDASGLEACPCLLRVLLLGMEFSESDQGEPFRTSRAGRATDRERRLEVSERRFDAAQVGFEASE